MTTARHTSGLRRPAQAAGVALLLLALAALSGWWRAAGTGPQVQVPMFYDAHYLFARPWTQAQSVPGVPPPALLAFHGANRVSQPFVAGADRLGLVSIWLEGPAGTPVTVGVHGADGAWAATVPLRAQPGWFNVTVPLQRAVRGAAYTVTLHAPTATADRPVLTRTVGGDRLGGSLRLNEYGRPGNVVVQTYSKGGFGRTPFDALAEQVVPAVFRLRLQQYKPAPLKGATFGALLLATALLSVAATVAGAARRGHGASAALWTVALLAGSLLAWQAAAGRWLPPGRPVTALAPVPAPLAAAPPAGAPRLSHDLTQLLWTAERRPEARFVTTGTLTDRPALLVPGDSALIYPLTVPLDGTFSAGLHNLGDRPLRFSVRFNDALLWETTLDAGRDGTAQVDLRALGGSSGALWLAVAPVDGAPVGGAPTDPATVAAGWVQPAIATAATWLADSAESAVPIDARFDDQVALVGYTLTPDGVTLYWRALQPTDRHPRVFVHWLAADGSVAAQVDRAPVRGTYPVALWQPGAVVVDGYDSAEFAPLPPGPLTLSVGLYDPATLVRWSATATDGSRYANDAVPLVTIDPEAAP